MKNKIMLLVLQVFLITNSYSQSLDSLVSEGLKNNPGITAIQKNISAAGFKGETFGYQPAPSIGIEFAQVPFNEPDLFNKAISQNLILSQMFMLGGKLGAMTEAEKKRADIIKSDLDIYKLNLIENIKKNYYDIWMMEHHIALWEDNIGLLKNIASSTEQMYQVNRTSYSDLLLIRAEIASAKNEIEVMESELNSMYYMMNSLLGRENKNVEITVQHNWEPDTANLPESEMELQLTNNPSLVKMDEMAAMNKLELKANSKEYYPDLMLQGMVMRMPQGMLLTTKNPMPMPDEMPSTEYMFSIMASVTLPFAPWSSGRIKAREEELLASIEGISAEKNNMQLMLKSEFYSLLNSVRSAREEMHRLKDEILPLYRQTIESQITEFQNNRNSIINLIQTLNMVIMKEEELAEVITRHQKKLSEIETITAASNTRFFNGVRK